MHSSAYRGMGLESPGICARYDRRRPRDSRISPYTLAVISRSGIAALFFAGLMSVGMTTPAFAEEATPETASTYDTPTESPDPWAENTHVTLSSPEVRAGEKVLASGLCMRGEYVAEWVHVFLRGKPLDGSILIGENEPVADDGSFEVSLQIPASVPSGEYTVGWMCGIDDVVLIHVFEGGPALTVPPGAGGPATSNSPGAGPTSTASSPSSTPHAASPGATPAANGEASNASTVSTAPTLATTGSRPANLGALSVIGIVNVAAAACLGQRRRRSSS